MLRLPPKDRLVCFMLIGLLCLSLMLVESAVAQPTGTISGRATSFQTGNGIFGANVSAFGPSSRETTTDTEGYYTLQDLAPGPYTIAASATSYVNETSSTFIYPIGTTPLDFQLDMRSIVGRVYDGSSPTLAVVEANITIGQDFILTNTDGCYEWLNLSPETYTLTASAPGYTSQSQQITVVTETTVTANFGLDPVAPGRVSGVITDSTTRDGLSGATVRIRRGSYEKTVNTDSSGQYSIENVQAWIYWTVDAYRLGYIAQTMPASVQSQATTTLNFELIPYGKISGTVKDLNTNQPIEGAIAKADSVFLDTTNSSGHYTMFAEAGTYTVGASAPGYSPSSQSNVKVSAGKTTTVNFLLQSVPPGSIVGLVTDGRTMLGIAGALVKANGHFNLTSADGNFVISDMPSWTYTISVSASGYADDSTQRTVPSGGSATANFALIPDTRVSVEPYLNFGNPEESFSVELYISDSRFVYSWEIYLWWNPALLEATSLAEGGFLKGPYGNRTTSFGYDEYANEGVIHAKCLSTMSISDNGVSGSGDLATLIFRVKTRGSCNIKITSALLSSPPPAMPTFPSRMINAAFRTLQSDVNYDGIVNRTDLTYVNKAYGSKHGNVQWNVDADVNRDQIINALDLQRMGKDYGRSF